MRIPGFLANLYRKWCFHRKDKPGWHPFYFGRFVIWTWTTTQGNWMEWAFTDHRTAEIIQQWFKQDAGGGRTLDA